MVLEAAGVSAGHGSQVRDDSGDEVDGLNETLCPCDFKHVCISLLACISALPLHTCLQTALALAIHEALCCICSPVNAGKLHPL